MSTHASKTHPILLIAGIAVIIFSAVGVGAIMGWIPTSSSNAEKGSTAPVAEKTADEDKTKAAAAETTSEKTADKSVAPQEEPRKTVRKSQATQKIAASDNPAPASKSEPKICGNCGVVQYVNAIEQKGEGTGLGAVAGGVAGALLGSQIGQGRGNTAATIVGAAGGAFAGHEVEKRYKATKHYEVVVRMDDGATRTFNLQNDPGLYAGDKVKVVDGNLVRN
jgi:outer membrane lipoprotein SlyB